MGERPEYCQAPNDDDDAPCPAGCKDECQARNWWSPDPPETMFNPIFVLRHRDNDR